MLMLLDPWSVRVGDDDVWLDTGRSSRSAADDGPTWKLCQTVDAGGVIS